MGKYIPAEKLIAEIEFAKSVYSNPNRVVQGIADAFRQDGRAAMCDDILKKIDSLQQEKPEGENMNVNIPERIFLWEDEIKEFLIGKRKEVQIGINQFPMCGLLTYVRKNVTHKVEQLEIDLEKKIDDYYQANLGLILSPVDTKVIVREIARHFYKLGLNARKEE